MSARGTGFVVVYQWRLKQGREAQFLRAWSELTEILKRTRGAHGSRLHRTEDGSLLAYAQWPDKATWEKSCSAHDLDDALSQQILDAVEETWSPMFLNLVRDQLEPEPLLTDDHVTH